MNPYKVAERIGRIVGYVILAAFDPPTVLALIAKLREAEAVIAQILDYEGPEAADMRDIALTYKPTNQEGS